VIEDFSSKYSSIDKRSGSIGPRRQNPIVKQQFGKRTANGMELTPKLPDCFLMGPGGMNSAGDRNNTSMQHEGITTANTGMKRPIKQMLPGQAQA
jgi:hypothetical protein